MKDIRVNEGVKPFKAAGQSKIFKVTGTVNQINIGKGRPQTVVTGNASKNTEFYDILKQEGLVTRETDSYFVVAAYPGSERKQSSRKAEVKKKVVDKDDDFVQ